MKIENVNCIFMILMVVATSLSIKITAADSLYLEIADWVDIIVDADGSGDYSTVQAAIDAIPNNNPVEKVIYIRNGIYKEKVLVPSSKTHITIIGEHVDSTILSYDDYSGRIVDGIELGTSTSYSFAADANDFTAMNLTFENSAGDVGQAVALRTNADRQSFLRCKMVGYQDTYYTWGRYRNYLKNCLIVGAIDYIFGATTAIFDSCQIHSLREGSYITAASTEEWASFGYVFMDCRLTAAYKKTGIYLGRPWKPYAKTVFYECDEGSFLHSNGWSLWSGNNNHTTCFYAEYKCIGPGSDTLNRVTWSHQLSDEEASAYTIENIFSASSNPTNFTQNWVPSFEDDFLYKAVKKYTTKFMDSANYNANLSEIKYDGVLLDEFSPDGYKYIIELSEGTTEIPVLEVATEDPKATYSIKYPVGIPGTSSIKVTAPDGGTFSTYTIFFSIDSAFANALLESLRYNYIDIPDFHPDVFKYNIELPFGTTRLPTIQAATQVDGATIEITRPEEVTGEGVVSVTSVDGLGQNTYTIDFSVAPSGIERNKSNSIFFITNPFSNTIELNFIQTPNKDIKLSIFNLQGELLVSKNILSAANQSIDASWLQNGVYIFRLRIDGKIFSGKIVKED
jgi:pectinesterase